MAQTTPAEDTLNHLSRLSQRPGVLATLIVSRETGAIVRATGLAYSDPDITSDTDTGTVGGRAPLPVPVKNTIEDVAAVAANALTPKKNARPSSSGGDAGTPRPGSSGFASSHDQKSIVTEEQRRKGSLPVAEEAASMIWRFFRAARTMVDEMEGEGEDEPRLLRLRMKKKEVVVYPDAKFLLIVIHDTPPA